VAERVRVRDITAQEGDRLLRIVRRSSGSVVTWRRAPGDSCPCPHWGYVMAGRLTVRYGDREEVLEPGTRSTCHRGMFPRRWRERSW
jgi:hypothetical protein